MPPESICSRVPSQRIFGLNLAGGINPPQELILDPGLLTLAASKVALLGPGGGTTGSYCPPAGLPIGPLRSVQGNFAHKKPPPPPPRTAIGA